MTVGFVGRRQHKHDPNRDVLEQVTLIKDIRLDKPHRAHLEVLFELSLPECAKWMVANQQLENFDGLLSRKSTLFQLIDYRMMPPFLPPLHIRALSQLVRLALKGASFMR